VNFYKNTLLSLNIHSKPEYTEIFMIMIFMLKYNDYVDPKILQLKSSKCKYYIN